MSAALNAIASTTIEVTTADAFGGFIALIVGILSFLTISGLALSMTIGASKAPSAMAITGAAALMSVIVAVGFYMTLTGTHTPELATWDQVGGVLALIVGGVGLLTIVGVMAVMTVGAFSPNKSPVTSWPTDQEHAFTGYDRRYLTSQSKAWLASILAGIFVFVFAIGVYKGVTPDMKDLSKDMDMSNLTKKSKTDKPDKADKKSDAPAEPKKEAPAEPKKEAPAEAPESK